MTMRRGVLLLVMFLLCPPVRAQVVLEAPPQDATGPEQTVPIESPDDERLEQRILTVLGHIDAYDDVELEVRDGVALLSGQVANAQARENVAELVGRFEGIIYVDNGIEVATDVESRLEPALDRVLRFFERFLAYAPIGLLVLLLLVVLWRMGSLIARWEAPATRFGWNPLVWALFRRVVRAVLVLVGLLFVFDILGVSALVGALLGTAGVVGIVLGFAFQDIAENYLAGMLMSIRQPFVVSDLVRIGEHEGRVVRLTSRELVLLTEEGNHVRMPNAVVFKSTIVNFTRNPRRRFHFDVGIGTTENIAAVSRLGRDTLERMPGVLESPAPFVRVLGIGDSSILMRFHGWVDQASTDFFKARSEAIRLVKQALDEAGVEMPDPRYSVHLRRESDQRRPTARRDDAHDVDVSPDLKLEDQVAEDLARSDEENLLDKDAEPRGGRTM